MKQRGFTVIELLVVITVMAILLVLAVVNVRSTQIQARDEERHSDITNISTTFESFYTTTHNNRWKNTYPGTSDMSGEEVTKFLQNNLGQGSQHAPGVDTEGPASLVLAANTSQSPTGVSPAPTITTYVYQPLTSTNGLCSTYAAASACVKYNIFYKLEKATDECPAPSNICVVRSQRQ